MSEVEDEAGNITDAIQQENTTAISKIRSLFIDPGFPAIETEDAGAAGPREELMSEQSRKFLFSAK
jgi:hypothetical protein